MFIEGVKIILLDADNSRIWRFRNDQGTHRNICVIEADATDQQLFIAALRWTLGGSKDKRIKACQLHLTDGGGVSWIVDRSDDQLRIFRNRQAIDTRNEQGLQEIFKDFLPADTDTAVSLGDLLREFDISYDGSHLTGTPRASQRSRRGPIERQGEVRWQELRHSLSQRLGSDQSLSQSQIEMLLQQGEGLLRRFQSVKAQSADITQVAMHLNQIDSGLASRLEQELVILEKVRLLAEPLLDPASSPKIIRQRLQEIEKQLDQLGSRFEIKALGIPSSELDWALVLQTLTRCQALEKLEKAARQGVETARSQLKPVFDDYRTSISRFLQIDRDLIRELEQCLAQISEQTRRAEGEEAKSKDGLSSRLNKLLGWQIKEGEVLPQLDSGQPLEISRAAVNLCLNQISKLYADLERHADLHDDKLVDLEERYEKIVGECGKAREQWQIVSRKVDLPVDISLRSAVTYISNYSVLTLLQQKRLKLQSDLQVYHQQARLLGQKLEEWRTHTGSQKASQVESLNLIMAEVRGVLQYLPKKREQLQKLKALGSKQEAFSQLQDRLNGDLQQISARWQKLQEHLGLPQGAPPVEHWPDIYAMAIEWLSLDRLLMRNNKALKGEQIFSADTLDHPVSVFHWNPSKSLGNKARIAFLQQLEVADDSGLGLILSDDATLIEMLQKLGVSLGQKSLPKPLQAAAQVPKKGDRTVISEKARAALEVFSQKQGASTREKN